MGRRTRFGVRMVGALVAGAMAIVVLAGAGKKKKDISTLTKLILRDKKPQLMFRIPKTPSRSMQKKGVRPQKWVFSPVETVRDGDVSFWQELESKWQQYIKNAQDPDRTAKLTPEQRQQVEKNAAGLKKNVGYVKGFMGQIRTFFGAVRICLVDPDNPATAVFVKTTEINKTYKIANAVQAWKQRPPPWRVGRVVKEHSVMTDERDTRFAKQKWEGWKLHARYTEAQAQEGSSPANWHDTVFFYRRVYRSGKVYLVEVHARWQETSERKKRFIATVDYLLLGLGIY